jgi:UDP-2,3-diacylglucosamine hydrolase
MKTLFISDLHLQANEPKIIGVFKQFMQEQAPQADALYILGDLFEAWIGDDDNNKFAQQVKQSIKNLTDKGVPCYFMRGNRDVAIGYQFAKETGVVLLDDPTVVSIYQRPVLLMHGDLLCTDDVKYQAFRRKVYDPIFRRRFLSLPLFLRRLIALWARYKSKKHTGTVDLRIQDVNQQAVEETLRKYNTDLLIHGHTHRPEIHELIVDDKKAQRIVLPAWHNAGHVLCISSDWQITQQILN